VRRTTRAEEARPSESTESPKAARTRDTANASSGTASALSGIAQGLGITPDPAGAAAPDLAGRASAGRTSAGGELSEEPVDVRCGAVPSYFWLKGRIDVFLAAAAIVLALPVFAVVAWLIRREGPGPIVFRQTRVGQYGRPFTMLKFRTMRPDADPYGDSPQSGDDARLTHIGRRLREWSLDELPQLINVLRGEMSWVGPRPLYVQQAAEWNARQRGRLLVKPGLTGMSQVHGRASITIEAKLEWDVRYVEQLSLRTDLVVLLETVRNVVRKSGLYERQYSVTGRRFSERGKPRGAAGF
jgi:lipopolysaccharide/colanic/teichoic acid biosynthesis glycosyltransferase